MPLVIHNRNYTCDAVFEISGAPFIPLSQFEGKIQWSPDRVYARWARSGVGNPWVLQGVRLEIGPGPKFAETYTAPNIPQMLIDFLAPLTP